MEKENYKIVLGENTTYADVTIREGKAANVIDPKPPVKTKLSGVIGAPLEYLTKRVETGQFTQERSHLIVDRENVTLSLIFNEHDEYERGQVDGKLEKHPAFLNFGINTGKVWSPTELGFFIKMNRAFFTDMSLSMKLVTDLMNFKASVNNKIEQSAKEKGDRTDYFAQVVNSNLPSSFNIRLPIFKGMPAETIEVETFVAQIDGREVSFTLISPGANQILEEIRDRAIDVLLSQIIEIAPKIAIIEV